MKGEAEREKDGIYIVYTGAAAENGSLKNDHTHLPGSLLRRRKNALVHSYKHGISGFAARLAAPEAQPIAKKHGVLSVFPDPVHHPHTTRSWDFLKYETDLEINLSPNSDWNLFSQGSDTIVFGPSLKVSTPGYESNTIALERKVNGSRSYIDPDDIADGLPNTPSDTMGHGTDVASTASGTMVPGGSYYGLAIRAFHAVENGITVVCSAGNEGPTKETDTNVAPWILTVAATTIDWKFFCLVLCWVQTRNCNPDSMVGDMIKEKIVICENDDDKHSQYVKKEEVQSLGGIAPGADMVAAWKSNDTEVTLRASQINKYEGPSNKRLGAIATAYDYRAGEIITGGP
ncbi:CO(2)-response secreted protease [Salix suchowensis]|nr:CO(2)-response secreted protease [Salix suchowensis]